MRKFCRPQPISMTIARIPAFHIRIVSLSMRQRLTLLLTCSMWTRHREIARFPSFCSGVNAFPRGFFVGWMIATPSSVNA